MSADFNENVIEFIEHETTAFCTFTEEKFMNRIKKLAERNKDCVIIEKTKSHVYAKFPVEWIQIRPKARFSEEQRAGFRNSMNENVRKVRGYSGQNEAKTDSNE